MDNAPQPPHDPELRVKIDKIAAFVAKGGPQAEERLRRDHGGKPQFEFLFGGEYSDYYKFSLQCEIYNIRQNLPQFSRPKTHSRAPEPGYDHRAQQGQYDYDGGPSAGYDRMGYEQQQMPAAQAPYEHHQQQHVQPSASAIAYEFEKLRQQSAQQSQSNENMPQPSTFDFAAAQERIDKLQQEIANSENNLKAHLEAIPVLKEAEYETAIVEAENAKVLDHLHKCSLDVSGLDQLLEQLHGKCSKDVVSNMKKWIFDYCTTDQLREVVLMYLLSRVRSTSVTEQFRLHVLYLINDWAHYCQRKKLDGVRQMLSRYVPQLYANAASNVKEQATTQKLDKLLGVWEGSKYFDDNCFKQLRNPAVILQNYRTQVEVEHQKIGQEIHGRLLAAYAGYEKQHNSFATHMRNNITAIEAQIEMERTKAEQFHRKTLPSLMSGGPASRRSRFDCGPSAGDYNNLFNAPAAAAAPPGQALTDQNWRKADDSWRSGGDSSVEDLDGMPMDHSAVPCPPEIDESTLVPRVPFYELPAGIIMGQINIEDLTYNPIQVAKLRLPPPIPPTPRLLAAIDQFYVPPSADSPRDAVGWEKNGLSEFFERKMRLRKVLEETKCVGDVQFEDLVTNKPSQDDIEDEKLERERNKLLEMQRARPSRRSRSRSLSSASSRDSRNKSRSPPSRSPPRRRKRSSSSGSSRSRRSSRSGSGSPKRRRSTSRSASPEGRPIFGSRTERSPSPPARYSSSAYQMPPQPLGTDNKGAQLMAKMGWSGRGLGAKEHGIQEPVQGGEVRPRDELYKGLGHDSEPSDDFEKFRKMRAGMYHDRTVAHNRRGKREDDE